MIKLKEPKIQTNQKSKEPIFLFLIFYLFGIFDFGSWKF